MTGPYEDFLEPVERALASLPPRSRAIVFAFGGERLLPLYESFSATASWGTPEVLRRALDWVWSSEPESSSACVPSLLDEIAEVTPHGDDYPTLEGLAAQDACVAVDSAVRVTGGVGVGAEAVWYCFEPLRAVVCDELTGALDVGSGEEAQRTEQLVVSDSRLREEMRLYLKVVAFLREEPGAIAKVKALAEETRWTPGALGSRR